eukprot:XP_010646279.1 PREDICTED: uncharacterized protein LOC104878154 isoform X1 [Vitis vinifera]
MSNVGIKRPCECTIAHDISLENVSRMHELSEAFHAISLRHTCLLSILEQFSKLSSRAGMDTLKRHLRISGPEGLNELRKIVERFEEKIYSTATSQILCSRNCLSSSFILASPFVLKVHRVKDMLFRSAYSACKLMDQGLMRDHVKAWLPLKQTTDDMQTSLWGNLT